MEGRSVRQEANTGEKTASVCDAALKKGKVTGDDQRIQTVMVLNICAREPGDGAAAFHRFKRLKTRVTLT